MSNTPSHDDRPLVERLRSGNKPGNPDGVYGINRIPLCAEAADRIEELERKMTTTITLDEQIAWVQGVRDELAEESLMTDAILTSLRELKAAQSKPATYVSGDIVCCTACGTGLGSVDDDYSSPPSTEGTDK